MDRRSFIWGMGGFFVGASLSGGAAFAYRELRRARFRASLPPSPPPAFESRGLVDGWILSAADRERIGSAEYALQSELLEIVAGSDIPGRPFSREVVKGVDDCVEACEKETRCTRFTFAKATHPDETKRNVCWIKTGEGEADSPRAPDYISGWRR